MVVGGPGLSEGPRYPPKTEMSPNSTHYFSKRVEFSKIKTFSRKKIGPSGGPNILGLKVNPYKTGKVTGFDELFLERGPIQLHIGSPRPLQDLTFMRSGGTSPPVPPPPPVSPALLPRSLITDQSAGRQPMTSRY